MEPCGEELLYCQKSRLYRFREGAWKTLGLGEARLLRTLESQQVRFTFTDDERGQLVAVHHLTNEAPFCQLRPNAGSDECWAWCAQDFSEGALRSESFALHLDSAELASAFFTAFEDAKAGCLALEEEELSLFSAAARLHKFKNGAWHDRGRGEAKMLKSKRTGAVRFAFEANGELLASHEPPFCELRKNGTSSNVWVWSASDVVEGDQGAKQQFALELSAEEDALAFKAAFDGVRRSGLRLPVAPAVPPLLLPNGPGQASPELASLRAELQRLAAALGGLRRSQKELQDEVSALRTKRETAQATKGKETSFAPRLSEELLAAHADAESFKDRLLEMEAHLQQLAQAQLSHAKSLMVRQGRCESRCDLLLESLKSSGEYPLESEARPLSELADDGLEEEEAVVLGLEKEESLEASLELARAVHEAVEAELRQSSCKARKPWSLWRQANNCRKGMVQRARLGV